MFMGGVDYVGSAAQFFLQHPALFFLVFSTHTSHSLALPVEIVVIVWSLQWRLVGCGQRRERRGRLPFSRVVSERWSVKGGKKIAWTRSISSHEGARRIYVYVLVHA